jgi:serine/threonine protein kinase
VVVPEVGTIPFPGYRLVRLRGHGGFATVWESDTPSGERIALKFMSSSNASTSSTARELRSLQAIQSLEHPNLLKIRQVWSVNGFIVIGMDLADASLLDLHELYVEEFDKLIEPAKLCEYLYQVAQALDFLNARHHRIDGKLVGLQHGDVKPNNVLLVGDQAKLADYGLATFMSGPTVPCCRQGTAEYCAPEVFTGHMSDRSDQFSLAVTYFVLRTGLFPYPEPPPRDQLKNYVRPEPDLSVLPYAEQAALLRALAAAPQNRYPSCVDLISALMTPLGLKKVYREGGRIEVQEAAGVGSGSKSKRYK